MPTAARNLGIDGKQTPRAPFSYFGGKAPIAPLVWKLLGNVENYIEPFCGSAITLLARPHVPRIETISDKCHFVANFWRATRHDPEGVVEYVDYPILEVDLYARHKWLVLSPEAAAFRERMREDPDYYDVKIAGWWCWGACLWIGGWWCRECASPPDKLPSLRGIGRGVRKKCPSRFPNRREWLLDWFGQLRDRLRDVRVCCGDWRRVCDSPSTTMLNGVTGLFLDPPYGDAADRDMTLYAQESGKVAGEVREYCAKYGDNPSVRIVLAGYAGEGHEMLEGLGWRVVPWRAWGGYDKAATKTKRKENAGRERLWVSPFCRRNGLFG